MSHKLETPVPMATRCKTWRANFRERIKNGTTTGGHCECGKHTFRWKNNDWVCDTCHEIEKKRMWEEKTCGFAEQAEKIARADFLVTFERFTDSGGWVDHTETVNASCRRHALDTARRTEWPWPVRKFRVTEPGDAPKNYRFGYGRLECE